MRAYLVYDRDTGKIVHRHRQSDKVDATVGAARERILRFVRPSLVSDRLDILVIDESDMKPGKRYRVNPDAKTLEEMP
jgi:hypothetical protein